MKQKVRLDEIKKTVKAFDPQVMSVIRGGDGDQCNCVLTCKDGDNKNGVFMPSTCCD